MEIKVGHGTRGDIYQDLEKVKACNFCKYFKGYGLHALCGYCNKLSKEIVGGYIGNYEKTAKVCQEFTVKSWLIRSTN